jgi:DNA polymerase alpha subunit B
LNATSILLEGSRHSSNGARVELDLSHLQDITKTPFSLFSGQVVAVEGINTTGRKLVAHRICEGAAHEAAQSTVRELHRYHHDDGFGQGGLPLKVMAVCGPYTTSDNLDYEALLDLLNIVTVEKTDVVILAGPFVSMRHPSVRSGQTTLQFQDGEEILVSYETFFANKIAALLEELYHADKNVHTQFVLVPSLDDATAEWVYVLFLYTFGFLNNLST